MRSCAGRFVVVVCAFRSACAHRFFFHRFNWALCAAAIVVQTVHADHSDVGERCAGPPCAQDAVSHTRARAHLRLAPRTGRSLGIVQCSCLRRHSSVAMHKLVRVAHVRCTCVRARAPAALANKQPNGPKFGGRSTRARPKSRVGRTRKAGSKR